MRWILFLLLMGLAVTARPQYDQSHFRKLAWLEGTWRMESSTGPRWETWTRVNDSSYSIRGLRIRETGDTILVEQISCRLRSGQLYYIPTVPGQNNNQPVPFIITKISSNGFTAENPRHDFPTRIEYLKIRKRKMKATISGTFNNSYQSRDFEYRLLKKGT